MTLDDLKGSVLRCYSNLFALEGQTVDEKIDYLQRHYYASPFPVSGSYWESHEAPDVTAAQQRVPPASSSSSSLQNLADSRGFPLPPPSSGVSSRTNIGPNFLGALYPVNAPPPEQFLSGTFEGGPSHDLSGIHRPTDQLMPRSSSASRISPAHAISGVLSELRDDIGTASRRLVTLTESVARETDNPNLRAFSYLSCAPGRRRPRFGTQHEMETHMVQLYKDLYARAEWNERRIRALRQRLSLAQMSARNVQDPRLAF